MTYKIDSGRRDLLRAGLLGVGAGAVTCALGKVAIQYGEHTINNPPEEVAIKQTIKDFREQYKNDNTERGIEAKKLDDDFFISSMLRSYIGMGERDATNSLSDADHRKQVFDIFPSIPPSIGDELITNYEKNYNALVNPHSAREAAKKQQASTKEPIR